MEFVILGILILVTLIAAAVNLAFSEPMETPKECSLHMWVYGSDDKMVCTECGYKPGNNQ